VLNSREAGEAREGDGALLLESTGLRDARVDDALGLLSLVFVARGWHLAPVEVARAGATESGAPLIHARHVVLPTQVLERLAGRSIPAPEVEEGFRHCRLDPQPSTDGWSVAVPPWRPDLQTATDLAEDLLLIRGVRSEDGVMAPSFTRGRRTPMAQFRAGFADRLLGLAFVPLYTPVLVSERSIGLTGRSTAIALSNPVSDQYAYLRDSLLPSLVTTLERNRRHGYPQRFSEVGPVVVRSPGAETGSETRYHAGALLAGDGAGFADAAALIDYLMRSSGATGIREPVEIPGTIPGRAAVVRLAGELVAFLGELHPSVLSETGVPVPVAWAEVDLSALAPLLGR
jgi:phenylalanyl-tRNA synthetase beta chain